MLQFERLMKLAPHDCTEQEVLIVLQEKAVLVQGCWVVASNLRYSKPVTIIRDYLLLLFTKSRIVQHSQLEDLRISKDILREILLSFAVQSGVTASWEFQESTDRSFIKRHQGVVKEQAHRWAEVEVHLRETVKGLELTGAKVTGSPKIDLSTVKEVPTAKRKLPPSLSLAKPPLPTEKAKGVHFNLAADGSGGPGQGSQMRALSGLRSSSTSSLSEATLAALPRALNKIFSKHSVCRCVSPLSSFTSAFFSLSFFFSAFCSKFLRFYLYLMFVCRDTLQDAVHLPDSQANGNSCCWRIQRCACCGGGQSRRAGRCGSVAGAGGGCEHHGIQY